MGVVAKFRVCFVVAVVVAGCSIRESNRKRQCTSNLKTLGYVLYLYEEDNQGRFPSDLGELLSESYLSNESSLVFESSLFLCPSAGRAVKLTRADLPSGAKDASGVFGPEHTDYAYVAGLTAEGNAGWLLMFDKTNHPGGVRNVLHLGGHVVSVSEEEFKRKLATTLKGARAAGYDVEVWGYGAERDLLEGSAPTELDSDSPD